MNSKSLLVPDRYDILQRKASDKLSDIIHPVDDALAYIDELHRDMSASFRGSFLIFRGDSGTGKSTFLHTIGLFREGVEVVSVSKNEDIDSIFSKLKPVEGNLRVIVLEGREALTDVSIQELEKSIHSINSFVRTEEGENSIIAWPVNRDDLAKQLSDLALELGSEALLGTGEPIYRFNGPKPCDFMSITNSTISILNEGATIHDLGISDELAGKIYKESTTIGRCLARLREELLKNQRSLNTLVSKEKCRVWTVVLAGNDPETDVDGLTRGTLYAADVDRMMSVTEANVVQELKKIPEKIGILGTYLDARIIHVKMIPTLSIIRDFADNELKKKMTDVGMSTKKNNDGIQRLLGTPLANSFSDLPIKARTVGTKPGSNTASAFEKLASIASTNDVIINKCFGKALVEAGIIDSFELEQDIGNGLKRRTDILAHTKNGPVRLEMMWRKKTSRAEIANYVLTKLYNYGKAVEYIT